MGGAIWLAVREWIKGLDTGQWIILAVSVFGVLLVISTYLYEWRKGRSIYCIPVLLSKIDKSMRALIQKSGYPPDDAMAAICLDLMEIFNIDILEVKRTVWLGNKREIRKMFNEKISNRPNPVPTQSLHLLRESLFYINQTFNTHNYGLESIKTDEYKKLENQLDRLRDRLIKANQIKSVRDYLDWWEGFCGFLLLLHYDSRYPIPPEILSARIRVVLPNIKRQTEGLIRNLLDDVRAGIFEK